MAVMTFWSKNLLDLKSPVCKSVITALQSCLIFFTPFTWTGFKMNLYKIVLPLGLLFDLL